MGYVELLLIAVGLSMDAFAVAICQGLNYKRLNLKTNTIVALYFGSFQAGMTYIGWALGYRFENYISSIDHWICAILLTIIGVQMVVQASKREEVLVSSSINHKELLMLSLATSIDALTVGIAFACISVNIASATVTIGVCTLVLSWIGVCIGTKFGARYKHMAECVGGIILISMGVKVLLEHLNIIDW